MHVNRCCNSGRQKCDEEREAEKVPKYKDLITETQCMWNVEAKVIADNNNRGNWNHLKVTQTVPEQLTGKAQDRGTTENSHTGHCRHSAGSADVEVLNTMNVQNNEFYIFLFRALWYNCYKLVHSNAHFVRIICKNAKLDVAETVNTEQLQHCIHWKHGLFQGHNCKYPA